MRTDAAGQSALLMIDVAEVLSVRAVPYAVIGAMAAAVHGVVRASLDAGAINRAGVVNLLGFPLKVISREDFVAMKAHAGGPIDLADARAVIEMDPSGLDRELVRRVAAGFGREAARRAELLLTGTD